MAEKITNEFAKRVFASNIGAKVNVDIADKYKLAGKKLLKLRDVVNDVFYKKIDIKDLDNELKKRLKIDKDKAKKMARDLAGQRFLVADEYFNNNVSEYLKALGADPADFKNNVENFKSELKKEKQMIRSGEKELEIPAEQEAMEKAPEIKIEDPEKDARDIGSIFDNQIVDILKWADFRVKGELNALIILLLIEKPDFLNTLLQKLTSNQEKLTESKIEVNNQTVEPTVANWLKDFVSIVGVEGTVTTIEKARYISESKNASKLEDEESKLLDMLLDTYVALRNFPVDAQRKDLSDIEIFPYTSEDLKDLQEFIKENQPKEEALTEPPKDIFELYMGSKEEQAKIESAKKELQSRIEKDSARLADELEVAFLKKDKIKTIAALILLVERGGFIDLLKEDIRYRDYLTSYLNRIGKQDLIDDFSINPTQPKFVIYLLKYILEERLEMEESEAARVATHFDTIYMERGMDKYGRLAYYDLAEKKFKWS